MTVGSSPFKAPPHRAGLSETPQEAGGDGGAPPFPLRKLLVTQVNRTSDQLGPDGPLTGWL